MLLVTAFFCGCAKLGSNADEAMEKFMRMNDLDAFGEEKENG